MEFGLFTKKLVASFAVVAALGGVALSDAGMPPAAADNFNQVAATLQINAQQGQAASRAVFTGFAKIVSETGKESFRLYDTAKIGEKDRSIRSGAKILVV